MRTKALLLTAALSAAGVATSMAQVYSVNAVGYVNLSLVPGLSLIANPLDNTNNNLNTIMALPNDGSADGTTIFRFNTGTQNYGEPFSYLGGFGWLTAEPDPAWAIINPGEGFFVQNIKPNAIPVTFVGDVPQGSLHNTIPGSNNLSIRSSQVPQAAPLGEATGPNAAGSLLFPSVNGDTVYRWDPVGQTYKEPYSYLGGVGWLSANSDDTGLAGPIIGVAESFFVQKSGALSQDWARTFSVN